MNMVSMMVNMEYLLKEATEKGYAVPQFNINNLEWIRYILEVCQDEQSPVILGASEGAIKYMGGYNVVSKLVESMIIDLHITVPVVLHLDHGSSIDSCKQAIDCGFTSVMIDASTLPLDENIQITKEVVEYASKYKVSVEAEIGRITTEQNDIQYADIKEAEKLYNDTHITALAPALGSVHGIYHEKPNLQYQLMQELRARNILLVLHGGSGIKDTEIKKSIEYGICKININTELQVVWATAVKNFLLENKNVYDPRKIIQSGEVALKQSVYDKIRLLGSNGKA